MRTIISALILATLLTSMSQKNETSNQIEPKLIVYEFDETAYESPEYISSPNEEVIEIKTLVKEEESLYSDEEIELIALVTMAEAEAEPDEGKRLVIDTILNRLDSEYFPNTINEVVYQENQYSSMWNGRVDKCYVKEDICQLVREEMDSRTNSEVIFFRLDEYSDYGSPMFPVGSHYFSSYD